MRIALTRREALDTPDGINIFLFSLAEALLEMGHQVTVVTSARNDQAKIRDFYSLAQWPDIVSLADWHTDKDEHYLRALQAWIRSGNRVIRSLDPDLVIVNGAVPIRLDAFTATVSHDAEKRLGRYPHLRTAFKRFCYARSDIVVATCEEVRSVLSEDLRMPAEQIRVIPTCVQLGSYRRKPAGQRENAILHMGTVDYKNPESSVRAFAAMATPDRKLYITGRPTDSLKALIQSLPAAVQARIELLGYVPAPQLIDLLGTVKIVSVPSVYAAAVASPTVIEALASGTPVVASTSISRTVVQDGSNGFVRDPFDPAAMAAACDMLLGDEGRWNRMAAGALASSEWFSARRVGEAYVGLVSGAQRARASRQAPSSAYGASRSLQAGA